MDRVKEEKNVMLDSWSKRRKNVIIADKIFINYNRSIFDLFICDNVWIGCL